MEKWRKNGIRVHSGDITVAEVKQIKKIDEGTITEEQWNWLVGQARGEHDPK